MFTEISRKRTRLADEVYSQVLDAVHRGAIAPEQRIVQERLAEDLNISRTPVREALLRLEQDGILVAAGTGGFVIRSITEGEVKEIYEARTAVEVQAARLLAEANDPERNAIIRTTIREKEKIKSKGTRDYFEANRGIHRTIVAQTRNRYLVEMFDNIWNRGFSFHLFAAIGSRNLSKSLGDHIRLIEAIESGDIEHTARVFQDHITDGLELQFAALKASRVA
ncbi:MAG: GntR family transcriptional regulator [Hyphomicrobiaceae bacterium]